jgi:LPXTG-motif cell wall-anchored protein
MNIGYVYTGHSLGPAGTAIAIVGIAARLGWMYWRRRNRG